MQIIMRKRKIQKKERSQNMKTILKLIMTIFLATISMAPIAIPLANAQSSPYVYEKTTYALIGATPNPVGINQEILIWTGISDYLRLPSEGWSGLSITIEKPDGKVETISNIRTDSTGSTGRVYVPTMTGTYKIQTHFPQQNYTWIPAAGTRAPIMGNVLYKASDSRQIEVVVQQEPAKFYEVVPLPTEYWTRPINAQFREWYTISGNWLQSPPELFAPYNDDAPESGHILWSKPIAQGGIVGGDLIEHAYEDGDAYEGFFAGSVVIGGVLYYNEFNANGGTRVEQEVVAVNLHTGEELWRNNWNNLRLAFGQTFYWESWNYQGAFDYLWATSTVGSGASAYTVWSAYDAYSGRWEYNLTGVPSGTQVYGPVGEMYIYTLDQTNGWITRWNSSRAVQPQTSGGSNDGSWIRNSIGTSINATRTGYDWNKTIPKGLPGSVNRVFHNEMVLGSTAEASAWQSVGNDPITFWAVSLRPGQEGTLLYNKTWQPPAGDLTIMFDAASSADDVFIIHAKETIQHWGFKLSTGEKIWGPTESEVDLGVFGLINSIAYGKYYSANRMGGILYCYDAKTGSLLWNYTAVDKYSEMLWSNNWPIRQVFITDDKVYLVHTEHSGNNPKTRGAPFIAINATTGEEIWTMEGGFRSTDWGGRSVIGDSIIATYNSYDQLIYAIGKGPSATSVIIQNDVIAGDGSVVIQGKVTDVSPGTKSIALTSRFPNGVPAVSDASQSEWMKYVYMQFPKPTDTTGVEVVLSVFDANGNFRKIGTSTSDANGFYSFVWKPDITGKYTVYATFEGSDSYYSSSGESAFVALDAATPVPTEQPLQLATETYFVPAVAGIIVTIIIVGAVLALLMLRKRP
jgi:outer membrane protein assembly factor BamB